MSQETSNNRLYVILVILSIAIVIIAVNSFIAADRGVKLFNVTAVPEQRLLSISGSASTFVVPDTASISLGVVTQAPTAKEASEKNAVLMNAVIGALKNLGLKDKEIRTSFLSVQPVYSYPRDGGAPTITGYSASNNVVVTTQAIDKVSDIVDKSVAAGANQVSSISFEVSDEKQKQIRNELIAGAVKDADGKANILAESLQVKIVGVSTSSISEGGFLQPIPFAAGIVEKAATPIQPGESRVTLSVQVVYIIE